MVSSQNINVRQECNVNSKGRIIKIESSIEATCLQPGYYMLLPELMTRLNQHSAGILLYEALKDMGTKSK